MGKDIARGEWEILIREEFFKGLGLLLQAYLYAQDVNRSVWDFAVEIADLREAGLTNSDFRWLACKGYVKHGQEKVAADVRGRQIALENSLSFCNQTCFVLTAEGVEFTTDAANRLRLHLENTAPPAATPGGENSHRAEVLDGRLQTPVWDADRRQLCFRGYVIKEFKSNSPNQESVLTAFEEEGWPPRILDPLPPEPELEPKERLRNTIKSLNRTQKVHLIRFMGDGTGEAIRWESLFAAINSLPHGDRFYGAKLYSAARS